MVYPRVFGTGVGVGEGVADDEFAYTKLSRFVFQLLELVTVTVVHGTFQFVVSVVEVFGATCAFTGGLPAQDNVIIAVTLLLL